MKVVAFVPIRLNSKRVVGKNLKLLGGKPMMCYLLETLVQVPAIDEVYVYCSSDEVRPLLPTGVKLLKRDTALDSDEALGEQIYDSYGPEKKSAKLFQLKASPNFKKRYKPIRLMFSSIKTYSL